MTVRVLHADWREGQLAERLVAHDAVVCSASLLAGTPTMAEARAVLSPAERARLDGYTNAVVARRFATGRAILRALLGEVTGLAPAAVPLRDGLHGKPALARGTSRAVHFSLSHSDDLLVVALCRHWEVGVDVERLRGFEQWARVAERVLDAGERRQLAAAVLRGDDPGEAFLRHWCRVEAELKAIGCGIAGLESHQAGLRPRGFQVADLTGLRVPPDIAAEGARYQGALVLCAPGSQQLVQAREATIHDATPTTSPARASTA